MDNQSKVIGQEVSTGVLTREAFIYKTRKKKYIHRMAGEPDYLEGMYHLDALGTEV